MAKKVQRKSIVEDESEAIASKALTYKVGLKCKNEKQKKFVKLLNEKKICITNAPAGVGKTYVAMSYALKQLKDKKIEKIVVVVPTCEAGGAELRIGLLPGTYEEKIEIYKMNIHNVICQILEDSGNANAKIITNSLFTSGSIDFRILNFMRGLSIRNSILYADECENFNTSEVLLLLTRIQNSQVILTGDIVQNDRKASKAECGLTHAINSLKDLDEVGIAEFSNDDIVRDPLITKILNNW